MSSAKDFLRFGSIITLVLPIALACPVGPAAASDAAPRSVVESFHRVLLDTMTNARSLGPKGRFAELEPVMSQSFDMPRITKTVVGSDWEKLSPDQQSRLVVAFERFEAAQFADFFDSYQGQKFRSVGDKPAAGDVIVSTVMEGEGRPELRFDYTVHLNADGWRIEDIRFEAWLSIVERRSAELRSVLHNKGVEGLISSLDLRTQAALNHEDDITAPHLAHLRPDTRPVYPLPIPLP